MFSRDQRLNTRDGGREQITKARQAAEALFTLKPPVSAPSVPEIPAAQLSRKPRVLPVISPDAPAADEEPGTPVKPARSVRDIPQRNLRASGRR